MEPHDQGSRGPRGYGHQHPAERDAGGQHDGHRRETEQERYSRPDDAPTSGVCEATRDAEQRQLNGEQQPSAIRGVVELQVVREAPDVPCASRAIRFATTFPDIMKRLTMSDRITSDPAVLAGVPGIRRLRVSVAAVVGMVASGMASEAVLADFPYLEPETSPPAPRLGARTPAPTVPI